MNPRSARSYLYTLRVWPEDLGNGHWEWRGVVKYVASGEEHYFRDWGALQELMVGMVSVGTKSNTDATVTLPTA